MFCDNCDRGYHSYCVGLSGIPDGTHLAMLFVMLTILSILCYCFKYLNPCLYCFQVVSYRIDSVQSVSKLFQNRWK